MVHATVLVSALIALVATVSAIPVPADVADVSATDYIGTGDIDAEGLLAGFATVDDVTVEDIAQNVCVLGEDDCDYMVDEYDSRLMNNGGMSRPMNNGGHSRPRPMNSGMGRPMGNGGMSRPLDTVSSGSGHYCDDECEHGLLAHLLKREEAAAPIRISKAVGDKGTKKNAKKATKGAMTN